MAFVVEFYYPDPHVAQRVDAELVSQMVALNLRMRINAASATTDFLQEQLALSTDPATKASIQSKLEQAQSAASHMRWEVFRVEKAASLPTRPDGWGRAEFGVVGALAGLVAGLIAAAVLGSRRPAIS
jgi:LPS O-antigen subunit length determinant protein (WzzB/FepE family)